MFELQGFYRLTIQMIGASHMDTFDIAIRNEDLGWDGDAVSDFISAQTAHDTLNNLAEGIIAGMLNNNSSRWTSGTVNGIYKVPPGLESV